MSFPRYTAYKDSGVDCWGMIPNHWSLVPLKRISPSLTVGIVVNPSTYVSDDGLPFIYGGDISEGQVHHETARRISDEASQANPKTRLASGDLLTVRVGAPGITAVVPPECEGGNCASVMLIRKGRFSSDWLCFALNSREVRYQVEVVQYGAAQEQFNINHAVDFLVAQPPMVEQEAIASFLNAETAKIDALVAEQEQLITLLKEKRQAVISHAVTKGLDPSVPMKDSGVEWLGEVPAHWDVKRIGHILDAIGDVDHFMPESVENGVPYLMTGDLKDYLSQVPLDDCKQVSHDDYIKLSKRIKSSKGDVVLARYATIGTLMYVDVDTDFLVSYSCVTLKANCSRISGLYLFHFLRSDSFRQGIEKQVNANTQGNVGIADLRSIKIALPPIEEQAVIAAFLDAEVSAFDAIRVESEGVIKLLKERRSALISAAVTGQIDVRNLP